MGSRTQRHRDVGARAGGLSAREGLRRLRGAAGAADPEGDGLPRGPGANEAPPDLPHVNILGMAVPLQRPDPVLWARRQPAAARLCGPSRGAGCGAARCGLGRRRRGPRGDGRLGCGRRARWRRGIGQARHEDHALSRTADRGCGWRQLGGCAQPRAIYRRPASHRGGETCLRHGRRRARRERGVLR